MISISVGYRIIIYINTMGIHILSPIAMNIFGLKAYFGTNTGPKNIFISNVKYFDLQRLVKALS